MSESLKTQEAQPQKGEAQLSMEQKVNQYQHLANKSLTTFYSNVDKLVSGSDGTALKDAAYNRIIQMNDEVSRSMNLYNKSGEFTKSAYKESLDNTLSSNKQALVQLGNATKESLDDLIKTGMTDLKGKNTLKISQTGRILDEIMKAPEAKDIAQSIADKSQSIASDKKTAGLFGGYNTRTEQLDAQMREAGVK